MRKPTETVAVAGDEIQENELFTTYEEALERFRSAMIAALIDQGLTKESGLITAYAEDAAKTLILDSGLINIIEKLVRTFDHVAAIKVGTIKDNALKRTLTVAAREQGIRISLAGDLAHRLNSGNVEFQMQHLHSRYSLAKKDLETAARLAQQYDGMKVPLKLQKEVSEMRESILTMLRAYPHLADQYSV